MQKSQLHVVPFDLRQTRLCSKVSKVKNPNLSESTMYFAIGCCPLTQPYYPCLETVKKMPTDVDEGICNCQHQTYHVKANRLSPTGSRGTWTKGVHPLFPLLHLKFLCQAWFLAAPARIWTTSGAGHPELECATMREEWLENEKRDWNCKALPTPTAKRQIVSRRSFFTDYLPW